jgi:hypothetical protein
MSTKITQTDFLDYRDLALANAAHDHLLLCDRIRELEADLCGYRAVTSAALDALHTLTVERDHLRQRLHRLVAELHALRRTERRAA